MAKWMIDPGHGGSDPGSTNKKTTEARMNLIVSLEVAKILKENGETVYLTRDKDIFLSLSERPLKAKNVGADYFISVHHNSFNGTARGTEIIYSLRTPKIFADRMLDSLTQGMGSVRRTAYQRKKSNGTDYYAVLAGATMQAMITEFCFLDNPSDYALVDTDDKLRKEGFYIARACLANVGKNIPDKYASDKKTTTKNTQPSSKPTTPKVVNIKPVVDFVLSRKGLNKYTQVQSMRAQPWNGTSDCSGLFYGAFLRYANIDIGSYTEPQSQRGTLVGKINTIDEKLMKPGDLVFYRGHSAIDKSRPYSIGHVEMYIGNSTLIGHGSGMGPTLKNLYKYRVDDFCMVRRYGEYIVEQPKPIVPPKPEKKSKYFKDIPPNHWSIDSFDRAKDLGILAGDGQGNCGFTTEKATTVALILRTYDLLKK